MRDGFRTGVLRQLWCGILCMAAVLPVWGDDAGVVRESPYLLSDSTATVPPEPAASDGEVKALYMEDTPIYIDESQVVVSVDTMDVAVEPEHRFNPKPMRAVWLSALFPGVGQIYNRRYWKLPIVVGGYAGLFYATSWNSQMLSDYQQAYIDIMDSDPNTNSYMNFFSSQYSEDDIDKVWLTKVLKSRKDSYRRNRDLCIISMIGLYLVCMIDAYVDAQLYHFDITPDVSLQWQPALIQEQPTMLPAVGLQCAIRF